MECGLFITPSNSFLELFKTRSGRVHHFLHQTYAFLAADKFNRIELC